ncbi:hypothetical protein D3C87_2031550 [compost metagenome]
MRENSAGGQGLFLPPALSRLSDMPCESVSESPPGRPPLKREKIRLGVAFRDEGVPQLRRRFEHAGIRQLQRPSPTVFLSDI